MHKITEKEFTMKDFSCEHLNRIGTSTLWEMIDILNTARTLYLEGGNYKGEHYDAKDKDIWWQLIQLLPSSYNQTRNIMLNYEVLTNIYKSRKDHKLDEWKVHETPEEHKFRNKDFSSGKWGFCDWIESLPYSELIIGFKVYDTVEYGKAHPEFVEKMNKIAADEKEEMVNLYGQLVPRKGIVSSSNYDNAVFNGEN